jgi:cytochrome c-type biogenesis protein
MKNKKFILLFLLFILLFSSSFVSAKSDIPFNLQKIIDYNKQSTEDFAVKMSFFIAFIAGMLSILSPCILPFLPTYFSYTFKEKKNITKMTFIFFIGFSLVFITMGIIAGFIGSQTLSIIQKGWFITAAGLIIIMLGIMSLLGKGFASFIRINRKTNNDIPGTFLLGVSFAAGWTACLGPILAGILGIGAILGNIWYSALLLFFYSLGNLIPLFILAVFYDKFNLQNSRFIKGRMFTITIAKKRFQIHSTNLISGILFIIIGTVLVIYKGTSIVNKWDIFGTKQYFYSAQNQLIAWKYANTLGVAALILFIIIISIFLWKRKSQ